MHYLKQIVKQQKSGIACGCYSACTANEYVIEAVLEAAGGDYAVIEATANQVNQFGGYTGMLPADFRDFVFGIADKIGFPREKIILGGDHLGPLNWQNDSESAAMEKSDELIKQYVAAGFTKIHLDTSMKLADDDKESRLSDEIIARRAARLCKVAEAHKIGEVVYVIGSEVPIPGGAQDAEHISVTSPSDFEATLQAFKEAFFAEGLQDAWESVVAVVVQPGVEFGDDSVDEYDRDAAKSLCVALKKHDNIVFEGHSTDYQTRYKLKELVEDGIAILKVGPGLTFAMREGLFALEQVEKAIYATRSEVKLSNLADVLEAAMLAEPTNWAKHYRGDEHKIAFARKFSYSDRARYYLPNPTVDAAICTLMDNLTKVEIPLTVVSQYLPNQYKKIREQSLAVTPQALLKDRIRDLIDDYLFACAGNHTN